MKRIRILLANSHGIRRQVTKGMIETHDMEVVEVPKPENLLEAVRKEGADAVIVALEGSKELELCSQLLRDYPNLTILLCLGRREFIDPSEASILDALRQAILAPCSSEEGQIAPSEERTADAYYDDGRGAIS